MGLLGSHKYRIESMFLNRGNIWKKTKIYTKCFNPTTKLEAKRNFPEFQLNPESLPPNFFFFYPTYSPTMFFLISLQSFLFYPTIFSLHLMRHFHKQCLAVHQSQVQCQSVLTDPDSLSSSPADLSSRSDKCRCRSASPQCRSPVSTGSSASCCHVGESSVVPCP